MKRIQTINYVQNYHAKISLRDQIKFYQLPIFVRIIYSIYGGVIHNVALISNKVKSTPSKIFQSLTCQTSKTKIDKFFPFVRTWVQNSNPRSLHATIL